MNHPKNPEIERERERERETERERERRNVRQLSAVEPFQEGLRAPGGRGLAQILGANIRAQENIEIRKTNKDTYVHFYMYIYTHTVSLLAPSNFFGILRTLTKNSITNPISYMYIQVLLEGLNT